MFNSLFLLPITALFFSFNLFAGIPSLPADVNKKMMVVHEKYCAKKVEEACLVIKCTKGDQVVCKDLEKRAEGHSGEIKDLQEKVEKKCEKVTNKMECYAKASHEESSKGCAAGDQRICYMKDLTQVMQDLYKKVKKK